MKYYILSSEINNSKRWITRFSYGGISQIESSINESEALILSEKQLEALFMFISKDFYEIHEYTGSILY